MRAESLHSSEGSVTERAEQEDTKQNTLMMFLPLSFFKKKMQISVWLKTCSLLQQICLIVQESLFCVYFLSPVSDQVMASWTGKHEAVWMCPVTCRALGEGPAWEQLWRGWLGVSSA